MNGRGRGRGWNKRGEHFRSNAGDVRLTHGNTDILPHMTSHHSKDTDTRGSQSMGNLSKDFATKGSTRGRFEMQGHPGNYNGGRGGWNNSHPGNYNGGRGGWNNSHPGSYNGGRGGWNNSHPGNYNGGRGGWNNSNQVHHRDWDMDNMKPHYPQQQKPSHYQNFDRDFSEGNPCNSNFNPPYNPYFNSDSQEPHPFSQSNEYRNMAFPQHDRFNRRGGKGNNFREKGNNFDTENSPQRQIREHQRPTMEDYQGREPYHSSMYPQINLHQDFKSPPPSYDESMRESTASKEKGDHLKVTPQVLVEILSRFSKLSETSETIGRHVNSDPSVILDVAKSRKDLFALTGNEKGTVIKLAPKLALCSKYLSQSGCRLMQSCKDLHICGNYINGGCESGSSCVYGHRWNTDHNSSVLCQLHLDIIDKDTLQKIVRKACSDTCKPEICTFYNITGRGCKYNEGCEKLHICEKFVFGNADCSKECCSLNHDILAPQCGKLLKCFGVRVNESPRDVLMHLRSLVGKSDGQQSMPGKESARPPKGKINDRKDEESKNESDNSGLSGKDHSTRSKNISLEDENRSRTLQSTNVYGDIEIPEICVFSIDNTCKNYKKGCKSLHAKSIFHWQVEKDKKWYNLRTFQSKKLEIAYCDVSRCTAEVPALDQAELQGHAWKLLEVLGDNSWKVDFQDMTMTDKNKKLTIRRLSTKSAAILNNQKATVFEWYFQDDQNKWIQYGQVDSKGNQHNVCNVSSEDIERDYVMNPTSVMLFSNALYKYKLDFSKMIQVNTHTGKERQVRRRPSKHTSQKTLTAKENTGIDLPRWWTKIPENQIHLLVELDSKSTDYMDVCSRVQLTLPTANIQGIQRLQNPFLWRPFQLKKANLSQRYGDQQLLIQKLFYGIDPQDIDSICMENVDWRRGRTRKQDYGLGTYFSNSAAVARTHCTPGDGGHVYMILANVIIGMIVKGKSSYTLPPSNPSTNANYDTTVDDVAAPTLFVKFEKDEYYPEYIIKL